MGAVRAKLKRSLGLVGATALGLGAMIGAGIFVLTGIGAGEAGPALILVYATNGLIALAVGACYAELAAMWPRDGGAYVWARPAFGDRVAFVAGWMGWFAQATACALYASAFGSFAVELAAELGWATRDGLPEQVPTGIALLLLLALLTLNVRGSADTARLEVAVTGLKIAILVVVVGAGLLLMADRPAPLESFRPFAPNGLRGVLAAMGLTFIAFEGFEVIVQTGEEARDPERTIPRAIGLSILAAVTIYLGVALALFGGLEAMDGEPVHRMLAGLGELGIMEAAGRLLPHGKPLLLVAGLASTASALNATVFGSTRIAYAIARDGDLPPQLAEIHPRHGTPWRAIQASGAVMMLGNVLLPIRDIAAAADIMFLLVFVLVCATLIRLRGLWADRARPFRVPLVPWVPGVGIVAGLVLCVALFEVSRAAWITASGWLVLGAIVRRLRPRPVG
jgi:amino acid transporter